MANNSPRNQPQTKSSQATNQEQGQRPVRETSSQPVDKSGKKQDARPNSAPPKAAANSQQSATATQGEAGAARQGSGARGGPKKGSPARYRSISMSARATQALDSPVATTPTRDSEASHQQMQQMQQMQQTYQQQQPQEEEQDEPQQGQGKRDKNYAWKAKRSRWGARGSSRGRQKPPPTPEHIRRSAAERQRMGGRDHRVALEQPSWQKEAVEASDSEEEDYTLEELRNRHRVRTAHLRRMSSGSSHWTMLRNYMNALNLKQQQQQVFIPEEYEVTRFWRIKVSEIDARFFDAVRRNNVDAMNTALAQGADPTARDEDGYNALHIAVEVDSLSALHALLLAGHVPVSASDTQGVTPLHLAVDMGKRLLVNSLIMAGARIDAIDRFGRNPLHYAILGGKVRIVKLLLYCGADPNMADAYGTTPLAMSVLSRPFPDIARSLLLAGALVDVESGAGIYLLSEAVLSCYTESHLDAIRVLLESGAEVNRQEEVSGQTPLHLAALSDNGSVAELLLKAGADPSITNHSGETAVEMALLHGSKDVLTVLTDATREVESLAEGPVIETLEGGVESILSEMGINVGSESEEGSAASKSSSASSYLQSGSSGIIHSVHLSENPIVDTPDAQHAAQEAKSEDTEKTKDRKAAPKDPGVDFVNKGMNLVK